MNGSQPEEEWGQTTTTKKPRRTFLHKKSFYRGHFSEEFKMHKMKSGIQFVAITAFALLLTACKGTAELKPIQSQTAGDYTVAVLSPTGTLKSGANTYVLEFRKTADKQLADVGTVEVSPLMEMSGMAPMLGTAE